MREILDPRLLLQRCGLIGFFPAEALIFPTEVTQGRGLAELGTAEIEGLDDGGRPTVEVFLEQGAQF